MHSYIVVQVHFNVVVPVVWRGFSLAVVPSAMETTFCFTRDPWDVMPDTGLAGEPLC